MNALRSPRAGAVFTGALLGAFIALLLAEVGVSGALKTGSLVVPGLVVGALIGMTRGRPVLWWICGGLTSLLLIVAYTPVVPGMVRPFVRADTIPSAKLDAVFVLSGGITRDGLMQSETLSRLLRGTELVRAGVAENLLASRESISSGGAPAVGDAADQAALLKLTGVTAQVFYIDSAASTRDEAQKMKALAAPRGWTRVAVVTSPLHTRRACATFERVGFRVTCVPSAAREFPLRQLTDPGDRVNAFRNWVYEMAGTLKYRAAGWIR